MRRGGEETREGADTPLEVVMLVLFEVLGIGPASVASRMWEGDMVVVVEDCLVRLGSGEVGNDGGSWMRVVQLRDGDFGAFVML